MQEMAITWGDLIATSGALLVIIGAVFGVWWRIVGMINAVSRRVEEVRAKGAKELSDYKLEAANRYATAEAIKEVEGRVVDAINRLGDRFDQYFSGQPSARRSHKPRQSTSSE